MADDIGLPGGAEGLDLGRVKRIMQVEARCMTVNPESTFLVCRAAELFLDGLTARSSAVMAGETELEYPHVAQAVQSWKSANFLSDIVPAKVQAGQLRTDPRFQGKGAGVLPLQPAAAASQPKAQQKRVQPAVPQPQQQPMPVASSPAVQHLQQPQQAQQPQQQFQHHHQQQIQQQQLLLQAQQLQQQHMEAQQQLLAQQRQLILQQQPLHLTPEQQALHMQLAAQQQLQYQQQLQLLILQQQQQQQQQQMLLAGQQILMGGNAGFPGGDPSGGMGIRTPSDLI
ncbi:hypothetical protein VaNZ11_012039 [Volvox africanus]|uniref:Transcription factor CBF/NF-Y/archaeal histone domain-containing protein n=1 Tax=Volvox africanus TaxID=51714 RepID=A0ABQ5SF10_9CHLO|nr:hypothetical protein VaNZ11_012039 [Volvox africanus]